MYNKTYQHITTFIVLLILFTSPGCSPLKTFYHPYEPPPRSDITPVTKPTHLSLWLFGFYNNEGLEEFDPRGIDYSPMIDMDLVVWLLEKKLSEVHQIQLISPPAWMVNDSLEPDVRYHQMHDKKRDLLRVMDHALKNRAFPPDFQEMTWIDIRPDREVASQKIASEVVCLVMGLASLTKQSKGRNYFRSGLGVILFHNDGRYIGMAIPEYDFRDYREPLMYAHIIVIIEEWLGLPKD